MPSTIVVVSIVSIVIIDVVIGVFAIGNSSNITMLVLSFIA